MRQEVAGLLEQLSNSGDMLRDGIRLGNVDHARRERIDAISVCSGVVEMVGIIDTAAGKYMLAAHERDAVAPPHEEHVDPRSGTQQYNRRRGSRGSDAHLFPLILDGAVP